eukprot:Em0004g1465a
MGCLSPTSPPSTATALAIVLSTPLVPNGIVTGYVVLQTNIPSGFSYMSTDLQPFTAYSCSILACTVRGCGSSTPTLAITAETLLPTPDGFDAVLVQNVGSTYIIVSWDLPTHSNGILINFSLYCNGALAGVLPLTVISYNNTGLLPFTLYMYITVSVGQVLQSRLQALHSSWNVVLGVISAAASLPRHKPFHTLFDLLKYGLMSKYNVMCSSLDPMEELTATPHTPAGAGFVLRSRARKAPGYFKAIEADDAVLELGNDDIFQVERLVALRKRKSRKQYLVLWEGYPKELRGFLGR